MSVWVSGQAEETFSVDVSENVGRFHWDLQKFLLYWVHSSRHSRQRENRKLMLQSALPHHRRAATVWKMLLSFAAVFKESEFPS